MRIASAPLLTLAALLLGGLDPTSASAVAPSSAPPSRRNLLHRAAQGTIDFFTGTRVQEDAAHRPADQLTYTTENGRPWFQPLGAQRVGHHGPLLLQDTHLLDSLAHFVRERIPERIVHARGIGAHGVFKVTTDFASKYSMADVFKPGTESPVTVRFSTVGGARGSSDAARDPRGFAIKIRTKSGILDWVFNNTPVFFIRDPTKFVSFIHIQKQNPSTNAPDKDAFWDWLGQHHEAALQYLRLMSDLGTPASVRHMSGWSGHTYRLVNKDGKWVYVRVLLETDQGVRNHTAAEAAAAAPESQTMDLYDAIERGDFPSWTVKFQVMSKEEAAAYRYDVLDLTKEWLDVPYHEVGKLTLNQNPVNYFEEIEQSHFSPSNMVDGWAPSNDPVLQARLWSYNDAGRHRLGPNYLQIPVNCPFNAVANFHRDGPNSVRGNQGARPVYGASTARGALQVGARPKWVFDDDLSEGGAGGAPTTTYYQSTLNATIDYDQPTHFYEHVLTPLDRAHLVANCVDSLRMVKDRGVVERVLGVFGKISAGLERGVREGLEGKGK